MNKPKHDASPESELILTMRRSPSVAFLNNPLAGYNLRNGGKVVALAERCGMAVHEGREPGEIEAALRAMAAAELEPELLVVSGGDGTVRAVAQVLRREQIFKNEPMLALLRGGSTNMIQNDVGLRGKPVQAMQRLAGRLEGGGLEGARVVTRAPLRVSNEGDEVREHGFFWGAGALSQVVEMTQAGYARGRVRGPLGESMALLGVLRSLFLSGSKRNPILEPQEIPWRSSGAAGAETKRLFVFATSLDKLILGLAPEGREGELKLVTLGHPHTGGDLMKFLMARGRATRLRGTRFEFASGTEFSVRVAGKWVLDGELFGEDAGVSSLRLKVETPFRFLIC